MKQKMLMITLLLLGALPLVQAGDITLSLAQKDYYFKTGEDAIINLQSNSTYDEIINGLLSYTITQSINQGNFQYSSSNTKSTSFKVEPGKKQVSLNFGSSDTPMSLTVGLKFSYTKEMAREVALDDIKIHFVGNVSQKKNQQGGVSSSSREVSASQTSNPFTQQEQRMQQMMNQMFSSQQQTPEQRLQNNQMTQDSSALKQQMQKQLQEQQQIRQEFQKQLAGDEQFQDAHQELLQQGYNLTSAKLNPETNNTGSFEFNYKKPSGEQASLRGRMQNGKVQHLQKSTPESRQETLEQLQHNKQFQQFHNQLQQQGYKMQNAQFSEGLNKTSVQVNYLNQRNETAAIRADIANNTVQKLELVGGGKKPHRQYLWVLVPIAIVSLLGYLAYIKNKRKPQQVHKIIEEPFDYKAEALLLLKRAEQAFEEKEYKNAYGSAAQALRLFLSYENGLRKELTNDEIILHLRKHKKPFKEAKQCFELCSLVEFAKYQANREDFNRILGFARKVIG